ncbi:INO80 complex subunit E [Narcine bancroftii]|uniref:INO80 complex subunit E n=1 Tax=Narcine bancroftii TaxID=1343680 RepID=UPI003831B43D
MSGPADGDYRRKYRNLKRKLKLLLYEQEYFQLELRKAQRKFIKVSRDKSFLLDRLLQYEDVNDDSSDSEATASSENSDPETPRAIECRVQKRRRSPPVEESASPSPTLTLGYQPPQNNPPTQTPYLSTMASPSFSQFPSEYLSSFPDPQGAAPALPSAGHISKGERVRREKRSKPSKGKRCKLPSSLRSPHPDSVPLTFPSPADRLCGLSAKLPPTTILSTVPQQMFSVAGEGSEEEPLDGDDDLVIDIPE